MKTFRILPVDIALRDEKGNIVGYFKLSGQVSMDEESYKPKTEAKKQ